MKPATILILSFSLLLQGCYTSYTVRTPNGHFERAVAIGPIPVIKKGEIVVSGSAGEKSAGSVIGSFFGGVIKAFIF